MFFILSFLCLNFFFQFLYPESVVMCTLPPHFRLQPPRLHLTNASMQWIFLFFYFCISYKILKVLNQFLFRMHIFSQYLCISLKKKNFEKKKGTVSEIYLITFWFFFFWCFPVYQQMSKKKKKVKKKCLVTGIHPSESTSP